MSSHGFTHNQLILWRYAGRGRVHKVCILHFLERIRRFATPVPFPDYETVHDFTLSSTTLTVGGEEGGGGGGALFHKVGFKVE